MMLNSERINNSRVFRSGLIRYKKCSSACFIFVIFCCVTIMSLGQDAASRTSNIPTDESNQQHSTNNKQFAKINNKASLSNENEEIKNSNNRDDDSMSKVKTTDNDRDPDMKPSKIVRQALLDVVTGISRVGLIEESFRHIRKKHEEHVQRQQQQKQGRENIRLQAKMDNGFNAHQITTSKADDTQSISPCQPAPTPEIDAKPDDVIHSSGETLVGEKRDFQSRVSDVKNDQNLNDLMSLSEINSKDETKAIQESESAFGVRSETVPKSIEATANPQRDIVDSTTDESLSSGEPDHVQIIETPQIIETDNNDVEANEDIRHFQEQLRILQERMKLQKLVFEEPIDESAALTSIENSMQSNETESQVETNVTGLMDDDDRTLLDIFGEVAKEFLTQKMIKETDPGCDWDWRSLRCEPAFHCSFQFKMGDYHFGRSCRRRPKRQRLNNVTRISSIHAPIPPRESATTYDSNKTTTSFREIPISDRVFSLFKQTGEIIVQKTKETGQRIISVAETKQEALKRRYIAMREKTCLNVWTVTTALTDEQKKFDDIQSGFCFDSTIVPLPTIRERILCGPLPEFPVCDDEEDSVSDYDFNSFQRPRIHEQHTG